MIYLRIHPRSVIEPGKPVLLGEVAHVMADAKWRLAELTIPLPKDTGIWLVDAMAILTVLQKHCPEETVTILGDSIGWLHRTPRPLCARSVRRLMAFGALVMLAGIGALTWRYIGVGWTQATWSWAAWLAGRENEIAWGIVACATLAAFIAMGVRALKGRRIRWPMIIRMRDVRGTLHKRVGTE